MSKALFAIIFILISGCATYTDEYVLPTTSQGARCVANCGNLLQSCQMQQQSTNTMNQIVDQQCQSDYTRALQSYKICTTQFPPGRCTQWTERTTRDANGRETSQRVCTSQTYVSPCVAPKVCNTPQDNSSACDNSYKTCYKSCGGAINRIELK